MSSNAFNVARSQPAVEVWEWKDAPPEWQAMWTERFPDGGVGGVTFRSTLDGSVHEYGPHLAVLSRPGCEAYATQALEGLDVDGIQAFKLPNGDQLDVIVAPRRREPQP